MSTTSAFRGTGRRTGFRIGRYRPKSATSWALAVVVLIALVMAAAIALMLIPPYWYRPIHKMNNAVYNQADRAQASLMALRNQLRNPPRGSITWTITQHEVNSLLAVAYGVPEKSKSAHNPGGFSDPYVRFTDNQITFAARDSRVPGNPVAGVGVRIDLIRGGRNVPQARITMDALRLGNFPLPPSLLTDRLKAVLPRLSPVVRKIIDVYAGPRYADVAAPQIVDSIAAIFSGKSFPTELRLNHRRLVVDKLVVHGPYVDASGRRQPAALTFELIPEK